ncbi:hypothetical protein [Allopontixanthobacter sp.]|uniref:hypothetical protein n=1 Tax=Allopontixanthobacter sp. TaxID=2906452 RepID=UPI002AB8AF93|nr:hypothetical protein [Allopontixanthobacter sp.]MDZ4306526.1 hypothetical protein [Allopontixanthobacter sp.]
MTKIFCVLAIAATVGSCSGLEESGVPIKDFEPYLGCYAFQDGTQLTVDKNLIMISSIHRHLEIQFRRDKWGDFILVRPAIWPRIEGRSIRFSVEDGQGVIVRPSDKYFGDDRLSFMSKEGKEILAQKVACSSASSLAAK